MGQTKKADRLPATLKPVPQQFINWWKDHEYSGYCEPQGKQLWTIQPREAWSCDRYRREYSRWLEDYDEEGEE